MINPIVLAVAVGIIVVIALIASVWYWLYSNIWKPLDAVWNDVQAIWNFLTGTVNAAGNDLAAIGNDVWNAVTHL